MNVNDSERVAGLLQSRGLEAADSAAEADFVFLNTCAVREKATAKFHHSLGRLRRLKAQRPDLRIGVGGCVAQLEGETLLERARARRRPRRHPQPPPRPGAARRGRGHRAGRPSTSTARPTRSRSRTRSTAHGEPGPGLRHRDGGLQPRLQLLRRAADPRARGQPPARRTSCARSRRLVARGFPEVMLLGQTVNAYRHGDTDFAGLLARVDARRRAAGACASRRRTPSTWTRGMADALRDLPRVCPYLHLPFQSGSDRVLASMRRGYTRQQYLDTVALLRDQRPGPGPVDATSSSATPARPRREFEETLRRPGGGGLRRRSSPSRTRPRPGTTALRLRDDVPEDEKRRRLHVVNAHQQQWQRRRNEALRRAASRRSSWRPSTGRAASRAGRRTSASSTSTVRRTSSAGSCAVEITGRRAQLPAGPPFASGSLTGSSAAPIFWPSREVGAAWKSRWPSRG